MATQAELEQAARELDEALGPPSGEWARSAHEDISERLTKAVADGKLGSIILSSFDANGLAALTGLSDEVRQEYGLPYVPRPSLAKSRFVPWWMKVQIMRRERAEQLSKSFR
jgi:hypothetical protein